MKAQKNIFYYLALFSFIFTLGCTPSTNSKRVNDAQLELLNAQRIEYATTYNTGALDLMNRPDYSTNKQAVALAKSFLEFNQSILGVPKPGKRLDTDGLLSLDPNKREDAWDALDRSWDEVIGITKEIDVREERLKLAEDRLLELGQIKEKELAQSKGRSFFGWLFATLGLGGIIALIIFCPVVLPILGQVCAWIIAQVPTLMKFLSVVGVSLMSNVVRGVGNFRDKMKQAPAERTYSKEEVLAMLDGELKDSTTDNDKKAIAILRKKENV